MNHLGMIAAIERIAGHSLPIINCPKCSSFWLTLMHGVCCHCGLESHRCFILAVAAAFLMAYLAIWIELLMGGIDILYARIYDTLYPAATNDDTHPSVAKENPLTGDALHTDSDMPGVRGVEN